jgi:hypothetical protein
MREHEEYLIKGCACLQLFIRVEFCSIDGVEEGLFCFFNRFNGCCDVRVFRQKLFFGIECSGGYGGAAVVEEEGGGEG